ncbi:MAG: preprotein translocase subunit SecE [Epsilonproteobacteria bacterium]|nr:preprotein translocase subunit SecE [Campylobacterota bacterium]NPA57057.1 preprotein translocase subunit SecE [Campylobacterota bacterium]
MEKILKYIHDARIELQKVIFPTKEQVKNAYIAVFLVVTVVALFLALVDGTMSFILSHIID